MISTSREWLHRVDSGPSGPIRQRRGSAVRGHAIAAGISTETPTPMRIVCAAMNDIDTNG